jgi:hypothetical protein
MCYSVIRGTSHVLFCDKRNTTIETLFKETDSLYMHTHTHTNTHISASNLIKTVLDELGCGGFFQRTDGQGLETQIYDACRGVPQSV